MNIKDKIKGIFGMSDNNYRTSEELKESAEVNKRKRIEKAREELNAHLQRSAQRGRHDYQEPNIIEQ